MFEDIKEPEDIFSEADKVAPQVAPPTVPTVAPVAALASSAAPAQSVAPTSAPVSAQPTIEDRIAMMSPKREFPWKPIVLVVAIIVVVGAAFYLSVQILSSRTQVTPEPPVVEREEGVGEEAADVAPGFSLGSEENVTEETEEAVTEVPSTVDTDKDGLTDEEETAAGTSPRAADTDGDGLFDPEEIRTWETDPLNPDTDGDGYLDGAEVSAGYNPNGEGKLIAAPTESD